MGAADIVESAEPGALTEQGFEELAEPAVGLDFGAASAMNESLLGDPDVSLNLETPVEDLGGVEDLAD